MFVVGVRSCETEGEESGTGCYSSHASDGVVEAEKGSDVSYHYWIDDAS
jgi:hypothetical protein